MRLPCTLSRRVGGRRRRIGVVVDRPADDLPRHVVGELDRGVVRRSGQVVGDDRRPLERVAIPDGGEPAGPAHRRIAAAGGIVPVAHDIVVHRGGDPMLVRRRHPAERVVVGDEVDVARMPDAVRIAGIVVIISDVAPLAAHRRESRHPLPERVVPGRHALAVEAVEPGVGLEFAEVAAATCRKRTTVWQLERPVLDVSR